MARRSLSSQVVAVVDRVDGNLRGTLGIVDPMTRHVIEQALEGLQEVRNLCQGAQVRGATAAAAQASAEASAKTPAVEPAPTSKKAPARRRTAAQKAVAE